MRAVRFGLVGLFILIAFGATTLPTRAEYKNLDVAAAAENFRQSLIKKYSGRSDAKRAGVSWAAAREATRQREWREAVGQFGRAAAYGANEHRFWLQYSYALGAVTPSRPRDALTTAYLARETARTRPQMAQALYYLGFWHERLGENDDAVAAYEDSVRIHRDAKVEAKLTALIARTRQQVVKTGTVHETDAPQICLTFSRPLPTDDLGLYARYVVVEPTVKAAFSVSDKKLCLEGVEHGKTYQVTVRIGLPDRDDT